MYLIWSQVSRIVRLWLIMISVTLPTDIMGRYVLSSCLLSGVWQWVYYNYPRVLSTYVKTLQRMDIAMAVLMNSYDSDWWQLLTMTFSCSMWNVKSCSLSSLNLVIQECCHVLKTTLPIYTSILCHLQCLVKHIL